MTTLQDIISDSIEGKYFRYIIDPTFVVKFPERPINIVNPGMGGSNNPTLNAWNPLNESQTKISLEETSLYRNP